MHGNFFDLTAWNSSREDRISSSKIYAYLRFTPGESLLLLANFSHTRSYNLKLQIPEQIEGIKIIHKNAPMDLKDKLGSVTELNIGIEDHFPVAQATLVPSECLIFEL